MDTDQLTQNYQQQLHNLYRLALRGVITILFLQGWHQPSQRYMSALMTWCVKVTPDRPWNYSNDGKLLVGCPIPALCRELIRWKNGSGG